MNPLRRPLPQLVITLVVIAVFLGIGVLGQRRPQAAAQNLQADAKLKWFRGNMHTHSLWSDGDDYLESIALWFREHRNEKQTGEEPR